MKRNYSMPSKEKKGESTLMELKDAYLKAIADKSPSTQSEITISVGKGRNKIYLTCASYNDAIALLDSAQDCLDRIPIGKGT